MEHEWLLISERIDEVSIICDREHPIYEQYSNFSLALYILGFLKCPDIMSAEDVDEAEAGAILKEYFVPVKKGEISSNYNILKFSEKYLLVIGDPAFPSHFAVLTDMNSSQPLFSKLKFYGTGFDSLAELESEFVGWEGVGHDDFIYFKYNSPRCRKTVSHPGFTPLKRTEIFLAGAVNRRRIEKMSWPNTLGNTIFT